MTVTYEKLQSWKPDGLSDAADKLNNLRKKLIDQQDEMDAGKPPETWQTPNSSEAARSRHKRLVEDLNDIAAPLSAVVAGLDSAASSLRSAKEAAKSAYDGAIGKGWTVKFPGGTQVEIEDPTPPESKAPGNRRGAPVGHPEQDTMDSYAETISKALADATEAETELEGVLTTATNGGYDGGDGEIADAIPPEIGKILASGQEDGDKPDKAAMQRYAAYMDELEDEPELKREIMSQMGREGIANALDNAKDVGVDLHAALGATGRGVIEDWVESDIKNKSVTGDSATLLEHYSKDSAFAKELYSNVKPEEFADAIEDLNKEAFPSSGRIDEAEKDAYSRFLKGAGATLATYSNGLSPEDAKALGQTWTEKITRGEGADAAALSLLFKKGGEVAEYQTDFAYNLANGVYEFEQNWIKEHEGEPLWRGRSDGILDPDDAEGHPAAGRAPAKWTAGFATDALGNILGGLNHSPDAAQRFFMDGYPDGDTSKDNERLKYLMLERTFSGEAESDEGDGLGMALEAATIGDRSLADGDKFVPGTSMKQNEFSAALASDMMQTIADYSGRDDGGDWDMWRPEDRWHIWPEMKDSLGTITSGYANDIFDLMKPEGATQTGADELHISKEDFKFVLGELGRGEDKSGAEMLGAALVQEGNLRIQDKIIEEFKDEPGVPSLREINARLGLDINGINTQMGSVLSETIAHSAVIDIDEENRAKAQAAFMEKAFSIGTEFVPGAGDVLTDAFKDKIGKVGEHFLTSTVDTASGEGLDALKSAVGEGPKGDEWREGQHASGSQLLERSMLNTYIRMGVIPASDIGPELLVQTADGVKFRDDVYSGEDIKDPQSPLGRAFDQWTSSASYDQFGGLTADGKQQFEIDYANDLEAVKKFVEEKYEPRADSYEP
ncbi:hypothetical protein [Nocardioides luteus]|uniref:hypothetical protein n=1 Tax=Nocardioides luteus TaxID=1844 RepID=UPI0018CB5A88|nr:hypothetical protein [Nocardioides luteus]MBG6095292.1 hypothetical protein [Nocardioides luteus]